MPWAARSNAAMAPPSSAAPSSPRPPTRLPLLDGWFEDGREQVWMSHGDHVSEIAPGFHGLRHLAQRALCHHRRSRAPLLCRAVPPRGAPHPQGRETLRELRASGRLQGRLDDGRLPRGGDRQDPRSGRRRQGDLRAVGRGRQLGRRRADPRGDRRPADLRLRRPRPAAAGRGRTGRHHVPRPLQHAADPCRRKRPVPGRAGRRLRPRGQAQDHRPAVHRRVPETRA